MKFYDDMRRMIERQKEKYGWKFLFLGTTTLTQPGKLHLPAEFDP